MLKPKSPIKVRKRWKIDPRTKVKESAKRYSRPKAKRRTRKAIKNAVKEIT